MIRSLEANVLVNFWHMYILQTNIYKNVMKVLVIIRPGNNVNALCGIMNTWVGGKEPFIRSGLPSWLSLQNKELPMKSHPLHTTYPWPLYSLCYSVFIILPWKQDHLTARSSQKEPKIGHWRSLEVIGGHWRSLKVIGDHWRSLEVIVGHWRSLEIIGGHLLDWLDWSDWLD